jgi:hypothetical protein
MREVRVGKGGISVKGVKEKSESIKIGAGRGKKEKTPEGLGGPGRKNE